MIPGFTSTGSKRPDALFGPLGQEGLPQRITRTAGCRAWDESGREYIDCVMALGAVALGYGHREVTRAVVEAVEAGVVGPLAPVSEELLAEELRDAVPWLEQVRFLKSGAEAVAAAVRIARAHTGRELVAGCGYHGWLDWCTADDPAVPEGTRAVLAVLPFGDSDAVRRMVRERGDRLAAIVVEPVIDAAPPADWLATLREECTRAGIVLVFDEIKTACRIAVGGAAERYRVVPDLSVLGKALGNGFPLAVVGGRSDIMSAAGRSWISSTLATEGVAIAAARATLRIMREEGVPSQLETLGNRLFQGLELAVQAHPGVSPRVRGIPQMCHLEFRDEATSFAVARGCARRGVLFKRSAYNFVSLAHTGNDMDQVLAALNDTLAELG